MWWSLYYFRGKCEGGLLFRRTPLSRGDITFDFDSLVQRYLSFSRYLHYIIWKNLTTKYCFCILYARIIILTSRWSSPTTSNVCSDGWTYSNDIDREASLILVSYPSAFMVLRSSSRVQKYYIPTHPLYSRMCVRRNWAVASTATLLINHGNRRRLVDHNMTAGSWLSSCCCWRLTK